MASFKDRQPLKKNRPTQWRRVLFQKGSAEGVPKYLIFKAPGSGVFVVRKVNLLKHIQGSCW